MIEDHTLAERIGKGPLPVDEAVRFARDLASALQAGHEEGITYGDLTPSNIRVTPEGDVKLPETPGRLRSHAQTVVAMSAAAYMSPEQSRGESIDKQTDIWAFGCVLFEMLTGRVPFDGETLADIRAAIIQRQPNWVLLPKATPLTVRQIIERCLQKDPRKRLHDIGAAKVEIEDVMGDQPRRHRTIARRIVRLLLVSAILAAVGFGSCRFWQRHVSKTGPTKAGHYVRSSG
jgi:eukaryotic-like serine/threonine-protein kinase